MNVAKIIPLELTNKERTVCVRETAVAGDLNSRSLVFALTENNNPWTVPEGVRAALAFETPSGSRGEYDTMPDGTDAFSIEGSQIRVRLIEQVMAQPGSVKLVLVLRDQAMSQLSAFPVRLIVTKGILDAQKLPKEYYRVRNLAQIDQELKRLDELLGRVDTDKALEAAQAAQQAAQEAKEAAQSVDADAIAAQLAGKGEDLALDEGSGKLRLISGGHFLGEGVTLPEGGGGLAFDSGYVDQERRLHLTLEGADIAGFTPFQLPGGGGGVGPAMRLTTSLENRAFSILDKDSECIIPFEWSSVLDGEATGSGFAEWTIGGSRVALVAVEQGEGAFDVRPYLSAGAENDVVLKITDVYGTFRTLSFTVTVTAYALSWNLGETAVYDGSVNLRITPTGTGEKRLLVAIDNRVVYETTVTTTGRAVSVNLGTQAHGAHTVTAWLEVATDGEPLVTERLTHIGVWLREGVTTPVVGVLTPTVTVGQYGTAAIRWFAVDPAAETATVTLKDGTEAVSVLENVGREVRTWAYKATEKGGHVLSICCGSAVGTVAVEVTDPGFAIRPVTAGLVLDLDPAGHSNSEAGRDSFGYTDGQGSNHSLTFSENFDWVGGGFREDEEGVTAFVVKRGCSVQLDRGFFDTDCRGTGRNLKLIFKARNVRNYDAELLRCKSGNVGIVLQAQQATVTSQLETMKVLYCEDRKIELCLNIESENENALAWIDLKGIQSCPPIRYGATDSWGQNNPSPVTIGSEEADVWIYRMKLWESSLGLYERLDEHIACAGTTGEMAARFQRNDIYNDDGSISISKLSAANPGLRVIRLRAERMTTGKEDEVTADFEMLYGDGGEKHHLTARNVTFKAQGTSSLEYILAALNLDVDFSGAEGFANGLGERLTEYAMTEDSIPVSYFNLKANVASSESCNNVCIADEFNDFTPFLTAARREDSRVRDSVEGHPCAVFFTSTASGPIEVGARTVLPGETILYFVGDMNNSKKNFAVFGQDNNTYAQHCSVEIMNNTERPCRFKEEISDGETWKGGNFEFRFPKSPTQEMKAAFRAMHDWVVSTDREGATGGAFAVPVTIGGTVFAGDTAEYRRAKFLAEFENYFVKDSALFFYLKGERHCLTDNRAKNVFPCYCYVPELNGYRWAFVNPYDCDTASGTENSGGMTFTYGLEDTDMVGDSWVFNAHDSVLWCNIRDWMADELKAYYASHKGSGVWSARRYLDKCLGYQSAVPEALRAEDMHNKYFLPWLNKDAAAYASKCHGTKEYQREQFEMYQETYMDSKYCDTSDRSDAISMRVTVERAENGDLTLTAYSDMYLVVMYGNGGTVSVRAKRNVPTTIHCPTDSLGDTETYIFGASNLIAISSLAAMKPKFVLATTAEKLQELVIGSGETGYRNLNLNQIGVGNNRMLKLLDLSGCPELKTALDLSGLTALERFLAGGSGLTGVSFARGCPLTEVRLPAVSSLTALELQGIESFRMDPSELKLIRVEDCPGIDTLAICKGAPKLERGRLTNVDWTDTDATTLLHLARLPGYDGQGKPTERFVLTGKAHVATIAQEQIGDIRAAFPELELSFSAVVSSAAVTFRNWDGSVLKLKNGSYAVFYVAVGSSLANPITAGLMDLPIRQSDVEHHYSYQSWDKALTEITGDLEVKAQYTARDRYYRVTYWADAAHSQRLQEETIIAHGASPYTGAELADGEQLWMGWDAAALDVVSDMDICALYITPKLPDSVPETFDFLYSDDPGDDSAFTLEEFAGIVLLGQGKTYFQIGDRIKLVTHTNVFADEEIVLRLEDFRHFRVADGSGAFAGTTWGMVGVMNANHRMAATATNAGGWAATEMRTFLNGTIFPELPLWFRKLTKTVQVLSSAGETKASTVVSADRLFLLSAAEVNDNAAAVPYCNEVDPEAEHIALPLFTDVASRQKKTYNGQGAAAGGYWLRSPVASGNTAFMSVFGNTGYTHPGNAATMSGPVCWLCCM